MENKLLSIIVPAYNMQDYLSKCLDSLLIPEPTFSKLEVLVINDGSKDNTSELAHGYELKYPGVFRVVDKENGGHGSAWNVGLNEATGKYLRFLDSDDWLTNLDRLLVKLNRCEEDIVFTQHMRWFTERNEQVIYENPIEECDWCDISSSFWGKSAYGYDSVNFWSATYKTSILKPLLPLFAEKVQYDDYILSFAPLVYGRTCAAYDFVVYNYLIGRDGQSMRNKDRRKKALSYRACMFKYEEVYQRACSEPLPDDIKECIISAVNSYAHFIFPHMLGLGFSEAGSMMKYLWDTYPWDADRSHIADRYAILPFPVFYFVEYCRLGYLRLRSK